ncbi:unnamed protein product [Cochlearia groenlandica]
MKLFICILALQQLYTQCVAQDFDFFYFVLQWPGAYCDSRHSCCYPKTGKPAADFGIHGLWPNYKTGGWPQNCNPDSKFNELRVSDLMSNLQKEWPTLSCPSNDGVNFWTHEWEKHGTCAESELDQHDYFEAGLKLKQKANLLHALTNAGIKPDDKFYEIKDIEKTIKEAIGFAPGIECNKDSSHNSQIYQIYLCVDTSASKFINCPVMPHGRCDSRVQFPKF